MRINFIYQVSLILTTTLCINSTWAGISFQNQAQAWRALQDRKVVNVQDSDMRSGTDDISFQFVYSDQGKRYELLYDGKVLGYADKGLGCKIDQDDSYNCIAINNTNCQYAKFSKTAAVLDKWQQDNSCGYNNILSAAELFSTLDKNLKIGTIAHYTATEAEYNWECAEGQELWTLKSNDNTQFLRHTARVSHYIDFLYSPKSKQESSYCLEKVADNKYKIQARSSNTYTNSDYLNKIGTMFSRNKETAGVFIIAFKKNPNQNAIIPATYATSELESKSVSQPNLDADLTNGTNSNIVSSNASRIGTLFSSFGSINLSILDKISNYKIYFYVFALFIISILALFFSKKYFGKLIKIPTNNSSFPKGYFDNDIFGGGASGGW